MISKLRIDEGKGKWLYNIVNALAFYILWFMLVFGAAKGKISLAVFATIGYLVFHFIVIPKKVEEAFLIAALLVFGLIVDTGFLVFGVLTFATPNPVLSWVAPIWIMFIYAVFGTTLNHCLSWLREHKALSSLLGFGGGAMSYYAGGQLGAAQFSLAGYLSPFIIGAAWFVMMPLCYIINDWISDWIGENT